MSELSALVVQSPPMKYGFYRYWFCIHNFSKTTGQKAFLPVPAKDYLPERSKHHFQKMNPLFLLAELCSQSDAKTNRKRNPGSSSSGRQHSPDLTCTEESPLRGRSRSPQVRPSSFEEVGYTLRQLGYICLISCKNESLQFEL